MTLLNSFESSGQRLFRYRSFLPLVALPAVIQGLATFTYFGNSHFRNEIWIWSCLLIALSGLGLRVFTVGFVPVGTSGRNTQLQLAQTLNTTGIYSQIRHPLYVGNYLALLGFVLLFRSFWLAALATCLCVLFYERITFAEEAFLRKRFGDEFEAWAGKTHACLPPFRGWVPSRLPYCWRTALRREYTGLLIVVGGFSAFDIVTDSIVEKRFRADTHWIALLVVTLLIYLTLRTLKKKTRLLHVDGR